MVAARKAATITMWLLAGALLLPGGARASGAAAEAMPPLVEAAWLAERLAQPSLVVLDIRSPIGGANRMRYEAGHIPGAVYSNFVSDGWHYQDSSVPATLPAVTQLEALLGRLGVGNDSTVVLVPGGTDSADFSTAARLYWVFRLLGHDRVAILDGGMRAWMVAGLPLERGWNEPKPVTFSASTFRAEWLATTEEVEDALGRGALLVDARVREQYEGRSKSPMAARAGTLPGAVNLEHSRLIDPDSGRFVGAAKLAVLLGESGIGNPAGEVVTFCNFGYLSAAVWFALHEIAGFESVRLYDGSMAEWTTSPGRPVMALPGPR
jgi:thiosulfate/3-mercaptopyruvate sulfurtransferase